MQLQSKRQHKQVENNQNNFPQEKRVTTLYM